MWRARPLLSRRGGVPLPDRAKARSAAKTRRMSWNVMFCHVLSCGVPPPAAICHGMSCFVCEWCICCVPFRHEAAVSGRGTGVCVRLFRLCVFGMGPSFRSRFVPPAPPPARRRRNPFPRVSRACAPAPGRARYAAARFARLIAPARARPGAGAPGFASGFSGFASSARVPSFAAVSCLRPAGGGTLCRAYRARARLRLAARATRRRGSRA